MAWLKLSSQSCAYQEAGDVAGISCETFPTITRDSLFELRQNLISLSQVLVFCSGEIESFNGKPLNEKTGHSSLRPDSVA